MNKQFIFKLCNACKGKGTVQHITLTETSAGQIVEYITCPVCKGIGYKETEYFIFTTD